MSGILVARRGDMQFPPPPTGSAPVIAGVGAMGTINGLTVNVPYPTGVQLGELLVIFLCTRSTSDIVTTPGTNDDWRPSTLHQNRATNSSLTVLTRVATSTDVTASSGGGNAAIVFGDSTDRVGRMFRIAGQNATTPINDAQGFDTGAVATSATCPAATASVNQTLVLRAAGTANGGGTYSHTWPTSTEQIDDCFLDGGVGTGLSVAAKAQAVAGGTGTEVATMSTALRAATVTVVIAS